MCCTRAIYEFQWCKYTLYTAYSAIHVNLNMYLNILVAVQTYLIANTQLPQAYDTICKYQDRQRGGH